MQWDWRRAFVIARWVLAVGIGAWTARQFWLVGHAQEGDVGYGALHAIYALAGLLASVTCIGPELVEWGSAPLNRLFDAVLLPSDAGPVPLDYTLARFYREQWRFEEACEEYFKIIRHHRRELPAYVEGIMTAGQAGRVDFAVKFHRLGRGVFRARNVRERLKLALEDSRRLAAEAVAVAKAAADAEAAAAAEEAAALEAAKAIEDRPAETAPELPPPAEAAENVPPVE